MDKVEKWDNKEFPIRQDISTTKINGRRFNDPWIISEMTKPFNEGSIQFNNLGKRKLHFATSGIGAAASVRTEHMAV